jgi:HEAT repeat protein
MIEDESRRCEPFIMEAQLQQLRRNTVYFPIHRRAVLIAVLAACAAISCRGKPPYEGKSVAQLERMLKSSDSAVQVQGAYGLSLKGAEARPAVPALIEQLGSPNVLVRQNAAFALGKIGPDAREAVPGLIQLMNDSDWTVRRQAAMSLGQIGPDAKDAVERLVKLRRDRIPLVRQAAEEALAQIDPSKFASKTN